MAVRVCCQGAPEHRRTEFEADRQCAMCNCQCQAAEGRTVGLQPAIKQVNRYVYFLVAWGARPDHHQGFVELSSAPGSHGCREVVSQQQQHTFTRPWEACTCTCTWLRAGRLRSMDELNVQQCWGISPFIDLLRAASTADAALPDQQQGGDQNEQQPLAFLQVSCTGCQSQGFLRDVFSLCLPAPHTGLPVRLSPQLGHHQQPGTLCCCSQGSIIQPPASATAAAAADAGLCL